MRIAAGFAFYSRRHLAPFVTLVLGMPDSTQAVDIPAVPAITASEAAAGTNTAARPDEVGRLYAELEDRVHELRPNEDLAPLRKAFAFAAARHQGQKRVSGEPYLVHPLMVARQLASMNMDLVCLDRKSVV